MAKVALAQSVRVTFESPDQPDVVALIGELDAYQDALYPPESRYSINLMSLDQAKVIFAVARGIHGRAMGCGAVVLNSDYGEVKRLYVQPEYRGRGAARRLLDELECSAFSRGCRELMLETGPHQPEALAFYERSGYTKRGPFGDYMDDPLSVFLQKSLLTRDGGVDP